jgi:hypothetical protein
MGFGGAGALIAFLGKVHPAAQCNTTNKAQKRPYPNRLPSSEFARHLRSAGAGRCARESPKSGPRHRGGNQRRAAGAAKNPAQTHPARTIRPLDGRPRGQRRPKGKSAPHAKCCMGSKIGMRSAKHRSEPPATARSRPSSWSGCGLPRLSSEIQKEHKVKFELVRSTPAR